MTTIICFGHHDLADARFVHGEEISPDVLSGELLDWWCDHGWAREHDAAERRSVFRLLPQFSECSQSETFTAKELARYGIDDD